MSSDSQSGPPGQSGPHTWGRQLRELLEMLEEWSHMDLLEEQAVRDDLIQRLRSATDAERLRARRWGELLIRAAKIAEAKAPRNFARELRELLEDPEPGKPEGEEEEGN